LHCRAQAVTVVVVEVSCVVAPSRLKARHNQFTAETAMQLCTLFHPGACKSSMPLCMC